MQPQVDYILSSHAHEIAFLALLDGLPICAPELQQLTLKRPVVDL